MIKITTKQKVYGVLLLAGFGALAIDRAFFSPSSAAAAPVTAPAPVRSPGKTETATETDFGADQPLISNKLKTIPATTLEHPVDAFSVPPGWLRQIQPAAAHSDFQARHKLSAVLASQTGGGAIVDGSFVRVGQSIDGYILTSLSRQSAVFTSGTTTDTLSMNQP